ncbi:MAG: hypothetical protein F2719_04015 [Actinobacteria bacterium]|nr:hypothetical protein [Actinomycetota bacterium]MSY54280.1 hypothetical protein [Actinomycetota bacterium]
MNADNCSMEEVIMISKGAKQGRGFGVLAASIIGSTLLVVLTIGNSAEGASPSVASQISTLQKHVATLQQQVTDLASVNSELLGRVINLNSTPSSTSRDGVDIYYYTLSNGCKSPADEVTTVPIASPVTIVCHLKVLVPMADQNQAFLKGSK